MAERREGRINAAFHFHFQLYSCLPFLPRSELSRVGMSEGGGLLGDYYTPHYEAPFGNRMAAARRGEKALRAAFYLR